MILKLAFMLKTVAERRQTMKAPHHSQDQLSKLNLRPQTHS